MKRVAFVALCVAAPTMAAPTMADPAMATAPTPAAIEASIEARSPKATIDGMSSDGWDAVVSKVMTGNPAWVALAPKLAPGSDAGSAEDLGIALAFALPKNPRAVLTALDPANGHVIGADRVCAMPFIENTVRNRAAYRRRAIKAVSAIKDAILAAPRAACLHALKRAT